MDFLIPESWESLFLGGVASGLGPWGKLHPRDLTVEREDGVGGFLNCYDPPSESHQVSDSSLAECRTALERGQSLPAAFEHVRVRERFRKGVW